MNLDKPQAKSQVRPEDKSLHTGHRQRLRARFLEEGLEGFDDHQVLELILFYAIPRGDTNDIAHRLMNHFGRLSAVFDARVSDLQQVQGMGEQAAVLIHTLPALMRRYHLDRIMRDAPVLDSADSVSDYLKPLMAGRTHEVFYVLCLDSRLRVKFPAQISQGTVKDAFVHPREVVEAALAHHAGAVVLAHNHPSGSLMPSQADHQLTKQLVQALGMIDIQVLDHVIIADDDSYSFAQMGVLPRFEPV
ncbi:MAG: DNA repair protein RadC [Arenicellales bacterium]